MAALLFSCGSSSGHDVPAVNGMAAGVTDSLPRQDMHPIIKSQAGSEIDERMLAAGLVDVLTYDSTLLIDLKYSTADNFLGYDVYGALNICYLQPDVAQMLANANAALHTLHPGFSLLVYDGARDTVKTMPVKQATYVSNPVMGSVHNFGAAVDLTICDSLGHPLDMGTPFDYFGDLAHTDLEAVFLASGELSQEQVNNRKLLRRVMRKAGFSGIQTEWWHFNACSREAAAVKYKILE
jgi:D-alanyl-D-alanine dipeptidase